MFSVALLLLLAAGCVKCEQLTQPASVTVQAGQRLTINCQVSYSLTNYWTAWIRQPAGKGLEWISSDTDVKDSLKNKFSVNLDSSSKTVTLNGQNVQPEDTAVYYCARARIWAPFDYWGRGTEVTVSSGTVTTASPTLFPLVQCNSGLEDKITVGCLAHDFYPKSLTFQWTDASGNALTSVNYPPAEKNNKYTGVNLLKVTKSDWDSRKSFTCSVNHNGSPKNLQVQKPIPPKVTLLSVPSEDTQALVCMFEDGSNGTLDSFKWKKNDAELNDYVQSVSVLKVKNADWDSKAVYTCEVTYKGAQYKKKASKALITVTLNQPSPKEIFNNKQAELECIITGQDETIVNEVKVTWQIDGQDVTDKITETTTSSGGQHTKTSNMTRSLDEWQGVNKVRCSAIRDNMTPVIQDLTVNRGDGSEPKVTVHVLPEEDISKGAEVTLVCLVSCPVLQDYYIAWSEYQNEKTNIYTDGINFPPLKTQHGYLVTSVYTTTKDKWNKNFMFECNVWPSGRNQSMEPRGVSNAHDLPPETKLSFALGCTEDAIEEDEFSSLWSTTSSFIFLFIFSLFYSMIFSLVKMKRQ